MGATVRVAVTNARPIMRWTQESLVKVRGILMVAVGVIVLIAYLISRTL